MAVTAGPSGLRIGITLAAAQVAFVAVTALPGSAQTSAGSTNRLAAGFDAGPTGSRPLQLDEVLVTAPEPDATAPGGITVVPGDDLQSVPQSPFTDLATGLSTLPGVNRPGRFSALLYIRGSQPYETLYVLNGVPLFNPYMWGGTLLMYNQALVDSVELYAGGFGPEYVETMGGVLDVDYTAGSPDKVEGEVQIGAETLAHVQWPFHG